MHHEPQLSLSALEGADADQQATYQGFRAEHLAGLRRPMDDMWLAFADMAARQLLCVDGQAVGICGTDEEHALISFYVQPRFQHRAPGLLRLCLGSLQARQMIVSTNDTGFLSAAMDVAASVEAHALLYAPEAVPGPQRVDAMRVASTEDLETVVEFQQAAIGAPREFLVMYCGQRIERGELLLVEAGGRLLATGEHRVDRDQGGIVQLGLIVGAQERGQGLGTKLMGSLVQRSREHGLTPYCSTEVSNHAAQRAIERSGFRAGHRVLRVGFAL